MKIDNQTAWRTEHLRAFITEACKRELLGADYRKKLVVQVRNRRRGVRHYQNDCPSVSYYYGRPWFRLMINPDDAPDKRKLAKEISLALAHCQPRITGFNKLCSHWGWQEGWAEHYGWAEELPLEMKPAKPAKQANAKLYELVRHAQKMANLWHRKTSLAQGKLSVWLKRQHRAEAILKKAHDDEVKAAVAEAMDQSDEPDDLDLTSNDDADALVASNDQQEPC